MADAMLDAIKTFKSPDGKALRIRIGRVQPLPTLAKQSPKETLDHALNNLDQTGHMSLQCYW